MSFSSLIKPPMWALQPALVAPEWQSLYRDIYFNIPMWGLPPFDHHQKVILSTFSAVNFTANTFGQVINWPDGSSDATGDYLTHPTKLLGSRLEKSSFTFVYSTVTTAIRAFFGTFNTGTATGIQAFVNSNKTETIDAGKLYFFVRDEDGSALSASTTNDTVPASNSGGVHIVTIVLDKALGSSGGIQIWFNGVEQAVDYNDVGAGTNFVDFGFDLAIGARNNRGVFEKTYFADMYFLVCHTRVLEDDEIIRWHKNPFGPFRMADEAGVVFAVAGGLSIPVAMHNYRRQRAA